MKESNGEARASKASEQEESKGQAGQEPCDEKLEKAAKKVEERVAAKGELSKAEEVNERERWEGYDLKDRRPADEFIDLTQLGAIREEDIVPGIKKLVIQEGTGMQVGPNDQVYYFHESRFDNG